jgi:flagellar hook protein FlgE
MFGAIYTGLSGMIAYSKGLQTISNNVANLNTNGFKATNLTFSDLYSGGGGSGGLTYLGSSFGGAGGNGVTIGSSLIDFSQGTLQQTNNALDLAIQGSGFLTLLKNGATYYTRTGSFAVDNDGYITESSTGDHLAVLDSTGQPVAVNVDSKRTSAPTATTKVVFSDNLSSDATTATVSNINVFDSRGGEQTWTVTFTKSTAAGQTDQWDVAVTDASGNSVGTSTLNFIGSTVDPSTAQLTITQSPTGADPLSVTLDFSQGVSSFAAGTASTIRAASVDGNAAGSLTGVTVDTNGHVQLAYSNQKTADLGAVALADFRDPQQLQPLAGGLYQYQGTGQMRLLASAQEGIGTLVSKQLEASNVDLSAQFGDLILVQRGFQACSEVISTSNDMIQQLFGIRGQG